MWVILSEHLRHGSGTCCMSVRLAQYTATYALSTLARDVMLTYTHRPIWVICGAGAHIASPWINILPDTQWPDMTPSWSDERQTWGCCLVHMVMTLPCI